MPEALSGVRCGLDREAKSRSWLCPAADAGTLTNPSSFAFTVIDHLKDKEKPREYAQRVRINDVGYDAAHRGYIPLLAR